MACYRKGSCGPYEMYSCSECPASKPEYAKRNEKTQESKKSNNPFEGCTLKFQFAEDGAIYELKECSSDLIKQLMFEIDIILDRYLYLKKDTFNPYYDSSIHVFVYEGEELIRGAGVYLVEFAHSDLEEIYKQAEKVKHTSEAQEKYDAEGVPSLTTIEEIVKGLELCAEDAGEGEGCLGCPFAEIDVPNCAKMLNREAVKVIRGLQKRLK